MLAVSFSIEPSNALLPAAGVSRLNWPVAACIAVIPLNRLPLDPSTWSIILTFRQDDLLATLGESSPDLQEFQSIVTALSHLPLRTETDPERIAERYREKEVIRRRLSTVIAENETLRDFLVDNLCVSNGIKGSPESFDLLDELVSNQAYRLAFWRVAGEEINYRRFFDINQF